MCPDCSFQPLYDERSVEISPIAFLTWLSQSSPENCEENSSCSCCDAKLDRNLYPPYLMLKPFLDVLDRTQKQNLIVAAVDNVNSDTEERVAGEHRSFSDADSFCFGGAVDVDYSSFKGDAKHGNHCKNEGVSEAQDPVDSSHIDFAYKSPNDTTITQTCYRDDASFDFFNLPLQNSDHSSSDGLVPVELVDFQTTSRQKTRMHREEDMVESHDYLDKNLLSEQEIETQVKFVEEAASHIVNEREVSESHGELESSDNGGSENSSVLLVEQDKQVVGSTSTEEPAAKHEDACNWSGGKNTPETITGAEASDYKPSNHAQVKEPTPPFPYLDAEEVRVTMSLGASEVEKDQGSHQLEKAIILERTSFAIKNHERIDQHISANPESIEVEEKFPVVPTYTNGYHQLHKKLLSLEKRESGAEESWDGSVISEVEGEDVVLTIERLKSALKTERKALSALYSELEEERSAAAIAANQTMSMITRLQEEKAAMQMEALQYQRMMEEQSEYDQEALKLLNELMVKREKEKQELERELEMYHKKVFDYEARGKMTMVTRKGRSIRSRNSSAASSINVEDTDELFVDHNSNVSCEESINNTPAAAVVDLEDTGLDCPNRLSTLDESLEEFEEERMSILEELKALEEKLFTLADDEEQLFEDVKSIGHFTDEYREGLDENYNFSSPEEDGRSHGFSEDLSGNQEPERIKTGLKAKRLLPLFDESGIESEEWEFSEGEVTTHSTRMLNAVVNRFELEDKKFAIEEEVDHVYERLQSLEADREFLKHCLSSLQKGDKGMALLQEILQHLRDLKTVEFRARNIGTDPLLCSNT
ncbi:hypothetical protein RJ639_026034 [Escallonia herrerae]|uniref:GTD-binding domain-containing protein n=1 Tax=Escallonia herrerae TaxID=1293975 RepID=A0AA88UY53_9ASTE|nr:hypothetical protein RJ639_026034 [Escallonia herrerae]